MATETFFCYFSFILHYTCRYIITLSDIMYINFCFNLYCIAGNLSTLAELCWKRKKWNFGLFIQGNLIIKKKKYHDIIEILLKVALNTMKKYPVIKQYTKNLEEMFFPPFQCNDTCTSYHSLLWILWFFFLFLIT